MMRFSTVTVTLSREPGRETTTAAFQVVDSDSGVHETFESDDIVLPNPIPPLDRDEDLAAYTQDLSRAVFRGDCGSKALLKARAIADTLQIPLRVRVSVGMDDELAKHHWELLGDPENDFKPLAWGERSCFSRYMPSSKVRVPARAAARVRSIALVAAPTNLEASRVDIAAEKAVISDALGTTQIRRLYGARASLERLLDELTEGTDVLYLACHGRMVGGRPYLYLEKEGGLADVVDANVLANRIGEMQTPPPPRLVVMAICDSAGTGDSAFRDDGGFFASAAAAMIRAGVPAVIGMQGAVAQATSRTFVKAFFKSLLEHGQVEVATAAARMQIPRTADWWVASLLLAVDDGVLWAGGPPREFAHWDELLDNLEFGECTAILGSEVIERLSNRNLAHYFTKRLKYPPRPGSPMDLARISQQLKVEIADRLPSVLRAFYRHVQTEDRMSPQDQDLARSMSAWGRQTLAAAEFDPYAELADLPVPLFITTNPDDLLSDALRARAKAPQVLVCPWQDDEPGQRDAPQTSKPTTNAPVVYHLFGHLADPQSVVLTEDDFFDHLVWVARHGSRAIPPSIPMQLANTSLLFLGFQLEDWEFRVLLRGLVKMQMIEMLGGRLHVAVQLDPTDLTPEQQTDAQRALEDHFSNTAVHLSIYWGTVELFLRELRRHRDQRAVPQPKGA